MAITPEGEALLNTIAGPESGGAYNVVYGGGRFNSFADHPRQYVPIVSGPNQGQKSSAAGKYQFLASTWDEAKRALNLPDFSPASQDEAAWWLAQRDYKARTGRDLQSDLSSGNPQILNSVAQNLSGTWTSLPSGIEQGINGSAFQQAYSSNLQNAGAQQSAVDAINQNFNIDQGTGLDGAVQAPVPQNTLAFNDITPGNAAPSDLDARIQAIKQQLADLQGPPTGVQQRSAAQMVRDNSTPPLGRLPLLPAQAQPQPNPMQQPVDEYGNSLNLPIPGSYGPQMNNPVPVAPRPQYQPPLVQQPRDEFNNPINIPIPGSEGVPYAPALIDRRNELAAETGFNVPPATQQHPHTQVQGPPMPPATIPPASYSPPLPDRNQMMAETGFQLPPPPASIQTAQAPYTPSMSLDDGFSAFPDTMGARDLPQVASVPVPPQTIPNSNPSPVPPPGGGIFGGFGNALSSFASNAANNVTAGVQNAAANAIENMSVRDKINIAMNSIFGGMGGGLSPQARAQPIRYDGRGARQPQGTIMGASGDNLLRQIMTGGGTTGPSGNKRVFNNQTKRWEYV